MTMLIHSFFRHKSRTAILLLLAVITYINIYLYHNNKSRRHDRQDKSHTEFVKQQSEPESIAGTVQAEPRPACVHPKLQLWHPDLAPYFKDIPPLQCDKVEENWVHSEKGRFKFSPNAVKLHGNLSCVFSPLIREGDDFTVSMGEKTIKPVQDGDTMPCDFGEIKCIGEDGKSYKNLISGIAKHSLKSRKRNFANRSTELNVLMLGFDSLSRMTFMRNLPKSHVFFVTELGGIVLEGYNIVGDGTPQALLPILTGLSEPELPEARKGFSGAKTVDGHPWIWKRLKEMGYVTQWGEDEPGAGTFTYRMKGFKDPPVDHYLRPFYLRAEKEYQNHNPYCLGSLPRHVNMLNWVQDFFTVYADKPRFSFAFHTEFSHNTINGVRVVDDDLLKKLLYFNDSGILDNTLLILMADHGARFQKVRETVQGKFEERMPYFALRFPPKFEKLYPEAMKNLRTNVHRLTTPFDIHATFQDLLDYSSKSEVDIRKRGISILKEIPHDRSCLDAGIEAHWCACLSWQKVDSRLPAGHLAAKELVEAINSFTTDQRGLCHELTIRNLTEVVELSPQDKMLKFKQSDDGHGRGADLSDDMTASEIIYQITIETIPGGGKFEGTVTHILKGDKMVANRHEISRINKYGNQPHCIKDKLPHLSPYCYCVETSPETEH